MRRTVSVAFLLVAAFCARPLEAQEGRDLTTLRRNYADRYFEPRPHLELAYALREKGQDFTALYLAETARRMFGYEETDKIWVSLFSGFSFDGDHEREKALQKRIEEQPGDIDAYRALVRVYQSRDEHDPAIRVMKRLVLADPAKAAEHLHFFGMLRGKHLIRRLDEIFGEFAAQHPEAPVSAVVRARALIETDPGQARGILQAAAEKYPDSALIQHQLAMLARERGDLEEAERRFVRAAELRPDSELCQGAAAKFFLEDRKDPARALPYMYATHFLNPYHFSDHRDATLARIAKIVRTQARKRAPEGGGVEQLVRSGDLFLATQALEAMSSDWKPEYAEIAADLLSHDFPFLATGAARLLAERADRTFEPRLAELLESGDLRVRARALYVAVGLRGEKAYPLVKEAFQSDCQLLRYEALGALFVAGGEAGRALVVEHRAREKKEGMLEAIKADLENWKGVDKPLPEEEKPVGGLAPRVVKAEPAPEDRRHVPHGCTPSRGAEWQQVEVRGATLFVPTRVRHEPTGIELLLVSPGWYLRGREKWSALDSRGPQHKVTLTRAFYLGVTEVTNAQYLTFQPTHRSGKSCQGKSLEGENQPVVGVSWADAAGFCDRYGFRLPTEAEWEFACRAGTGEEQYGPEQEVAVHSETLGDRYLASSPVGTKKPNAWGLLDMLGNAWEWCGDWHDAGEYERCREGVTDPSGPAEGECRVFRGGAWNSAHCDVSERRSSRPGYAAENRGFRVCMDPARPRRVQGLTFVWVPPGSFRRSRPGDVGPAQEVKLDEGFWISTTEVTNRVFDRFDPDRTDLRNTTGAHRPAVYVNWHAAKRFCEWLTKNAEGEFRLPSEAEWEYAALAGSKGAYCFGDDPSLLDDYAWYEANSFYDSGAREVATKKPNLWGLYDVHGNAWEWCEDRWHESLAGAPADGSAWAEGTSTARAVRGGNTSQNAAWQRCSTRTDQEPDRRAAYLGFRVVARFPGGR